MYIPLHKPYFDEQEQKAVTRAIKHGMIGKGPFVSEFEKRFKEYIGASHAIAVNSCTSALQLCVDALDIYKGDEVIVPSMTFSASVLPILYKGATPVFVDILDKDMCVNPDEIERKITNRTKAIIIVHYAGVPCNLDKIREICRRHTLPLIEDAAHALPTLYHGEKIGVDYPGIRNMICFSFQATKNLSIGDGGMVVTSNGDLADIIRERAMFGMKEDKSIDPRLDHSVRFYLNSVGYKCNMTDVEAAIGISQLKKLDKMNELRVARAKYYANLLGDISQITLPEYEQDINSSWYVYVIRIKVKDKNDDIRNELMNYLLECGIQTAVQFQPVHMQRIFNQEYKEMEVTELVGKSVLSLPMFPGMKFEEIDYIAHCIHNFFKKQEVDYE